MKCKVDLNENSTKRGLVWTITFVIGIIMSWMGKDVSQLLLLGSGVAGGLGIALSDKNA